MPGLLNRSEPACHHAGKGPGWGQPGSETPTNQSDPLLWDFIYSKPTIIVVSDPAGAQATNARPERSYRGDRTRRIMKPRDPPTLREAACVFMISCVSLATYAAQSTDLWALTPVVRPEVPAAPNAA